MPAVRPRRRELAQLVPNHLLGHEDRHVDLPGKIVDARAQVRITRRSFVRLSDSILSCNLTSIYGPFLDDLDTPNLLV
jgi:hypothetical protein